VPAYDTRRVVNSHDIIAYKYIRMTEKFIKPFNLPHTPHESTGPLTISFGTTFVECQGIEESDRTTHRAAVVLNIGDGDNEGFTAATLLVAENKLVRPKFSLGGPGSSWRESIVRLGLSHIDPELPDHMSPVDIYNAFLNDCDLSIPVDFSHHLTRFQAQAARGSRRIG
jgi:hypothetical protein